VRFDVGWRFSKLKADLPSVVIQTCWAESYQQMFGEMEQWMTKQPGVVRKAILLKWTLKGIDDVENAQLDCTVEVFVSEENDPTKYHLEQKVIILFAVSVHDDQLLS
jgi:hypothetical protein